jgi:hypothetical protein
MVILYNINKFYHCGSDFSMVDTYNVTKNIGGDIVRRDHEKEGETVAKPIEATPTLFGKDAENVIFELTSRRNVSPEKKKTYDQNSKRFSKLKFRG